MVEQKTLARSAGSFVVSGLVALAVPVHAHAQRLTFTCGQANAAAVSSQGWSTGTAPFGKAYESWTGDDFSVLKAQVAACGDSAYADYIDILAESQSYHRAISPGARAVAPQPQAHSEIPLVAPAAEQRRIASPQVAEAAPVEHLASPSAVTPSETDSPAPVSETITTTRQAAEPLSAAEPIAPAASDKNGIGGVIALLAVALLLLAAYSLPAVVAFARGHSYRWVILAVNVCAAWTGVGWVAMLVWAAWPAEKALIDPVVGNVTGTGLRNAGDALGGAEVGRERGRQAEPAVTGRLSSLQLTQLEKLAALHAAGVLTDDEFAGERAAVMGTA